MDSNHLRFNQSDGSVSLIVQTGFMAKNQLLSICPDPSLIPNLPVYAKENIWIDFMPDKSLKISILR